MVRLPCRDWAVNWNPASYSHTSDFPKLTPPRIGRPKRSSGSAYATLPTIESVAPSGRFACAPKTEPLELVSDVPRGPSTMSPNIMYPAYGEIDGPGVGATCMRPRVRRWPSADCAEMASAAKIAAKTIFLFIAAPLRTDEK